jgi:hypothetical protein
VLLVQITWAWYEREDWDVTSYQSNAWRGLRKRSEIIVSGVPGMVREIPPSCILFE